jgi:elongation factor P
MSKVSTSDFQKGMFLQFKEEPHQITDLTFVSPGKGSAFVRVKLKSLKSGKVQEFTYKSGETAESIPIEVHEMQYLYKENQKYVFMDNSTYEQTSITKEILGNFANFLKEGEIYQILLHNSEALGMRYPKKVSLRVTEGDEGARGNTVMGARKNVIVETGVEVSVPIFIKKGDVISIDPENGEYLERYSMK